MAEIAGCQKKAYAHQSWPHIVNYIIIRTHDAIRKCNVKKNRKKTMPETEIEIIND